MIDTDQKRHVVTITVNGVRHTASVEADKARNKIEEPVMMAERQVYVEGLAFLRITERLGLTLQAEYLYLPSLARVPMGAPFPGE